jgi:hypothetical protein
MVEPLPHYCDTGNLRQAISDTIDLLEGLDAQVALLEQKQQQAQAAAAAAAAQSQGATQHQQQQAGLMRVRSGTAAMQQLQEMQQEQQLQQERQLKLQQRLGMGANSNRAQQRQDDQPTSPDAAEFLASLLEEPLASPLALDMGSPKVQKQQQQQQRGVQDRLGPAGTSLEGSVSAGASPTAQQAMGQKRKQSQQQQRGAQSKQPKQGAGATAAAAGGAAAAGEAAPAEEDLYDPPGGFEGQPDMSYPAEQVVAKAAFKLRSLIAVRCDKGLHDKSEKPPYYLDQVSGTSHRGKASKVTASVQTRSGRCPCRFRTGMFMKTVAVCKIMWLDVEIHAVLM